MKAFAVCYFNGRFTKTRSPATQESSITQTSRRHVSCMSFFKPPTSCRPDQQQQQQQQQQTDTQARCSFDRNQVLFLGLKESTMFELRA